MLTVEEHGDVAVVRIEHGRVNALDLELLEALTVAVTGSDRPLVITGTGSAFSAGVDLRRIVEDGDGYTRDFLADLSAMFRAVFDHPRPTVAAINGHAIAGGCVLGLACDVRLMAGGRIGLSELAVGVPFPVAALEIVRHGLGPRADRAVLGAEVVDRDRALTLGVVDELCDPDALLPRAVALAGEFGSRPADVYASAKERLHRPAVAAMAAAAADDDAVLAGWTSDAAGQRISAALAALSRRA
jgi:enoyl-CoA hydratase